MLVMVTLAVLFFLPTLIGLIRRVDGLTLVFLVNLIGAPSRPLTSEAPPRTAEQHGGASVIVQAG